MKRQPHWDHLLWDVDGTLVDSRQAIHKGHLYACRICNRPAPSKEAIDSVIGMPLAKGFEQLFPTASTEEIVALVDGYREAWFAGVMNECSVFAGIHPLLQDCLVAGYRQGVASAKSDRGLDKAMQRYDLGAYFETVCGARPGEQDKTAVIGRGLAALGNNAPRTLMIGDRHHDIRAAQQLGLPAALVTWGKMTSAEEIREAQNLGVHVCHQVDELRVLLLVTS